MNNTNDCFDITVGRNALNSSFVPVNNLPLDKIELAIDQACSY